MGRERLNGESVRQRQAGAAYRSERGASLVEFALILPVFAMLVIGGLTGARAYNSKLTMVGAAREATRYGATLPVTPTCSGWVATNATTDIKKWLSCVEQAAVQAATGDLNVGTPGRSLCIAFVNATGTGTATTKGVFTTSDTTGTFTSGTNSSNVGACDTTTAPGTDQQVQVVLQRSDKLDAVAFSTSLTLTGSSVSRYERTT